MASGLFLGHFAGRRLGFRYANREVLYKVSRVRSLAERFDYQKLLDLIPTGGTTNGTATES